MNGQSERIRAMLDERGVEYDGSLLYETEWTVNGVTWHAKESDGLLNVYVRNNNMMMTPEQAIAAALGSGKLTAEQVREAWRGNLKRDCLYDPPTPDWQAIAEELNATLGSGTCEKSEPDGWHKCDECGCVVGYWHLVDYTWTIYMDDYQIPFNNCPSCGAKIRKAVGA